MLDDKLERLRARAEAALGRGDLTEFIDKASVADYKSALAEMAIYQAELRAQHEDLEDANNRAANNLEKLRELLNQMEDPYVILDHHHRIVDANRAADQAYRLHKAGAFDNFSDRFAHQDRAVIRYWLGDKKALNTILNVTGDKPDNRRYSLKQHPFKDETILVIARDMTDLEGQSTISEQLRHALKRIEELQQERETAFAYLAHEMRTPASSIAMLLETDNALRETCSGQLIEANIQQVLAVMDDLKVIVKPDEEVLVSLGLVDPHLVVSNTLAAMAPLFEKQGITVHLSQPNMLHRAVNTDIKSVTQVVTNLFKNAALHSGASELWVMTSVVPLKSTTLVVIKVADNGVGIPDSDKNRIFLPFERGSQTSEGTGIGLDVCRRLAIQLGGNVVLRDSAHGGCEFTFSFYAENVIAAPEEVIAIDDRPLSGLRVLFADDDAVIRQFSGKILDKLGAEVIIAQDGAQALDQYRASGADLVVTDIMMPNLDGIELTRELRTRGFKGLIVGCSAATVGDELAKLLAAGADAVLPKPLSSKALTHLIANLKANSH